MGKYFSSGILTAVRTRQRQKENWPKQMEVCLLCCGLGWAWPWAQGQQKGSRVHNQASASKGLHGPGGFSALLPSSLDWISSLGQRLTILSPFTSPRKTLWPLCWLFHKINILSGLTFKSDTYICSGFIYVHKDSICDEATVGALSSDPHGNGLLDVFDCGTHKGREESAQGATAKMFNKYIIDYIVYIFWCLYFRLSIF